MSSATFHYDFGSPYAYLAAERIDQVLGPDVAWAPVFLVGVFKATGRRSWVYGEDATGEWDEVARRAAARGLPPLHLVDGWAERLIPGNTPARSTLMAQRVAHVAGEHGRARPFALGLFRAVFQRAADLTDPDTVAAVASAAGVPPDAVAAELATPSRQDAVRAATEAAVAGGVSGVPTVLVGGEAFWGDDRLEDAAAALHRAA